MILDLAYESLKAAGLALTWLACKTFRAAITVNQLRAARLPIAAALKEA